MPPCSRMNAPAAASSSSVVTPGREQRADVRDRLGDERAGGRDLLDLARALADDHLRRHCLERVLDRGEDVVHRLLAVDDDLDPRELVAVDHELGELVVEAEAVGDGLGRVVGAALPGQRARAERSVATSSETWSRITASSGLPISSSIESSASACGTVRGKPSRTKPVLVREPLADEVDHEVVGHEVAALEDRANLPRRARSRPRPPPGGCRPSRRAGCRTPRRSASPGSLFRTPVGRG